MMRGHFTCPSRRVRADRLDAVVWQALRQLLQMPTLIPHLHQSWAQAQQQHDSTLAARQTQLLQRRQRLERQSQRLLDAYQAEIISLSELQTRRLKLTAEMQQIEQEREQLARTQQQTRHWQQVIEHAETFRRLLGDNLDRLSFEERQAVAQCLIRKVVVTGEPVDIYYVLPFEGAPQAADGPGSMPEGTPGHFYRLRLAHFDLPPCFIDGRNRGGGQMKGSGPEHIMVASLRVTVPHPPERIRVGMAVLPSQDDVLVRGHALEPIHRKARCYLTLGIDFLTGDKVYAVLGQAEEEPVIDVAPIHGHDTPLGQLQPAGHGDVAPLAGGHHHNGRQVAGVIQEGMHFDGSFGRAEVRPGEQIQAQRNRRAVQGKERIFEAQPVARGHRLAACVQGGKKALVECGWPSLVGLGERGAFGRAHAEGGERVGLGGHRGHHVSQTVTSSQLGEDQGPDLAPPAEHSAGTSGAICFVQ
jgi:hypothetical protein